MKLLIVFLSLLFLIPLIVGSNQAFSNSATITIVNGAGATANANCVIVGNCFSPSYVRTSVGDTVDWYNGDTLAHTVTSGKPSDTNIGTQFDSGLINAGGSFSYTFENAGVYNYFCTIHPWMIGQISVSQNPYPTTPAPQPSPSPTCPQGYYYHASDNLCYQIVPPSLTLQTPYVNGLSVTIAGQSQAITTGTSISRILWDWGDGYSLNGWFPQSHSYSQAGTYNVKVTAYDSFGSWRTASELITVQKPQPTCQQGYYYHASDNVCYQIISPSITLETPNIDGLGVTMSGQSQAMTFDTSISKIVWDWGDGYTANGWFPQSHSYSQAGTYNVQVTAYDSLGNSRTVSEMITVQKPQPTCQQGYYYHASDNMCYQIVSTPQQSPTVSQPTTNPTQTTQLLAVPQDDSVDAISADGLLHVHINYQFSQDNAGKKAVHWYIFFEDSNEQQIPHSNYAISVMQDGHQLLFQTADYAITGGAGNEISDLSSFDPIGFKVTYLGVGLQYSDSSSWTGPKGDIFNLEIPKVDSNNQSIGSVTVNIDKKSYNKGDLIAVSGTVSDSTSADSVKLELIDPSGGTTELQSAKIQDDKTYSLLFNADDAVWKGAGTYTLKATYGNNLPTKTSFELNQSKTCFLFWCW